MHRIRKRQPFSRAEDEGSWVVQSRPALVERCDRATERLGPHPTRQTRLGMPARPRPVCDTMTLSVVCRGVCCERSFVVVRYRHHLVVKNLSLQAIENIKNLPRDVCPFVCPSSPERLRRVHLLSSPAEAPRACGGGQSQSSRAPILARPSSIGLGVVLHFASGQGAVEPRGGKPVKVQAAVVQGANGRVSEHVGGQGGHCGVPCNQKRCT